MKIALIAGHFMPEVGYQEVYLARAFTRLGHRVRVFTSEKPSPSAKKLCLPDYRAGLDHDPDYGFEIERLKASLSLGTMVIASGLGSAVAGFGPDLVVAVGAGKFFPYPLLRPPGKRRYRLATLFGNNSDFFDWTTLATSLLSTKLLITHKAVKQWAYRKAVASSDALFMYTPETESIITSYLPGRLRTAVKEKSVTTTLGFDPNEFFFDETERTETRQGLGIPDDCCAFITSTRVYPGKNLEQVINAVSHLHEQGKAVRYIIIGFLADDYERRLKAYIGNQPDPDIFHCYPFLKHHEIRRLFSAADAGIWQKAAISIQESMGTGLPVILENRPSVGHLIEHGVNGWSYEQGHLSEALSHAAGEILSTKAHERRAFRKTCAELNRGRLSYDTIVSMIIETCMK